MPDLSKRASLLDPFKPYLNQRLSEGYENGLQLWREIQERGYRGSRSLLSRWVAAQRGRHPVAERTERRGRPPRRVPAAPRPRRLSARQASWVLIRPESDLSPEQRLILQRLEASHAEIAQARCLAQQFRALLQHRDLIGFERWLATVAASEIRELVRFAEGLSQDANAVRAAVVLEWSNGQVEGHVNRLKLIKRQMYGRAKFDLLRARVLAA